MSKCCKCCEAPPISSDEIDETDPDIAAAAAILIDMSRSHLESEVSSSCECNGLSSIREIIREADEYPDTEVEDWKSMGTYLLRLRASRGYAQADINTDFEASNVDALPKDHRHEAKSHNTVPVKKEMTNGSTEEIERGKAFKAVKAGCRRSQRVRSATSKAHS